MEELIKQLEAKTGLGADQIRSVVEGVADFLGDKLPDPIGAQIRKFLGDDEGGGEDDGDEGGGGLLEQAQGLLGGLLGGD